MYGSCPCNAFIAVTTRAGGSLLMGEKSVFLEFTQWFLDSDILGRFKSRFSVLDR
jgi:hypothetical protein